MHSFARSRTEGFTLVEILMVVVIIGILLVLVVPNVVNRVDDARIVAAQHDLRAIGNALQLYRLDNGHYPSTQQGLAALVTRPSGRPEPRNWGPEPYLKKVPIDQWGNEFVYSNSGRTFDLYSMGEDGREGGTEYDADIHLKDI